jgi:hypothetical protein
MASRTVQNRVNELNEAGVNTNRFVFNLPDGLNAGSSVTIDVNNGQAVNTATGEAITVENIVQSGYIKNNNFRNKF